MGKLKTNIIKDVIVKNHIAKKSIVNVFKMEFNALIYVNVQDAKIVRLINNVNLILKKIIHFGYFFFIFKYEQKKIKRNN